MTDITAKVSKTIAAPPVAVWAALTDPASLKQFFFGADVDSDWTVGSRITFSGVYKDKPYQDKGEILVLEPQRRLAFSHFSPLSGVPDSPENYHVVTFDLSPVLEGTEVTLSQSNLTGGITASDRSHRAEFEKNWQALLDSLDRTVTRRD